MQAQHNKTFDTGWRQKSKRWVLALQSETSDPSLLGSSSLSRLHCRNQADRDSDPFAEADEHTGETKQAQQYIHIRIQRK